MGKSPENADRATTDLPRRQQHPDGGNPLVAAEMNSFIGRTALLAEGRRLSETARLVTCTGPGGGGKTRLPLRPAGQLAASEAYQHGGVVARLADSREGRV